MTVHASHPAIINRLKRAHGHLAAIIEMMSAEHSCTELAQQLQAVEGAIKSAKKALIHEHINDCLAHGDDASKVAEEFRAIAKFL